MKFNIWQSYNDGLWNITYHQNLTALEAAAQLAAVVESELELRKTTSGEAEYEIRPVKGSVRIADPLIPEGAPIREKGCWAIPNSLCRTCLNLTSPYCDTVNKKLFPNKNGVKSCEGYEGIG